jgi:acyl carrier protein
MDERQRNQFLERTHHMSDSEIKLKKVLANVFKIEAMAVNEDTSVDTVERWDSLSHLNLILALELEFGISFNEEQSIEIMSYPLIKMVLQEHGVRF